MEPGPELSTTRPRAGGPPAGTAIGPPGADVANAPVAASALEAPARSATAATQPSTLGATAAELGRSLWRSTQPLRFAFVIYVASRALLLLVGIVGGALQGWQLTAELSNWDGVWYVPLARNGYPPHASHLQTTLGFFPGYPWAMWLVKHLFACSFVIAGLVISAVTGFVATVFVQRLSTRWWGEEAGRRAVVAFCLFPGSVVFSMVYSEGPLLMLVGACLLALEDRRFVLAGLCAAFATSIGPDALAIVVACGVASALEIRRLGWHDSAARRSLVAPLLSPIGIIGVGLYLWARTGTPFATFEAQRYGWGERTDALALVRQAQRLVHELTQTPFSYHNLNLNYVAGTLGAIFLAVALVLLVTDRRRIPGPALAWTLGISFFCVTSEYTPPNPRLLLTAFPVVVVMAHRLGRRGFRRFAVVNGVLLVAMSAVTFVGIALRP